MTTPAADPPALEAFVRQAEAAAWVTDVLLGGSLASGEHVEGVSDIDLVAITDGPATPARLATITGWHREIDVRFPAAALGCTYVCRDPNDGTAIDDEPVDDPTLPHPTWTHGRLVRRRLSGIARAELLGHGRVLLGRPAAQLFAPMGADDVRCATAAELDGYWAWAVRRPWLYLDPATADLALVTMARARHSLLSGELVSKTDALKDVRAPRRVAEGVRRRRQLDMPRPAVASPATSLHAWLDTRRTIREAAVGA